MPAARQTAAKQPVEAQRQQLDWDQQPRDHQQHNEIEPDPQPVDHAGLTGMAGIGLFLVLRQRNAIEFEAVADKAETVFTGDPLLERFDLR